MFKKLILKNVNEEKDIPLNKEKKVEKEEATNHYSFPSNIFNDYCGDCIYLNMSTKICGYHNVKTDPLDLICNSFESILM